MQPDDQPLLGMSWEGHTLCDKARPTVGPKALYGSGRHPFMGLAVSNSLHYLDDFFFWSEARLRMGLVYGRVDVPQARAPGGSPDPTTAIVFLGILVDSVRQVRLPDDKLARLGQELRNWGVRRAATKRQLQSLIGLLNHAAKVVRPGRPFLRGLIDAMKIPRRQNQKVRLNLQCRGDIVWWQEFLHIWNGVGFFPGGPLRATL